MQALVVVMLTSGLALAAWLLIYLLSSDSDDEMPYFLRMIFGIAAGVFLVSFLAFIVQSKTDSADHEAKVMCMQNHNLIEAPASTGLVTISNPK